MKQLWSPWRMSYIQNHKREEGCAFCKELIKPDGPENLIVFRGQRAFLILNRFPYTCGHLLVVPYDHLPSLEDLDRECRSEVMEIATQAVEALKAIYRPEGFNLGINIGEIAGAGIAGHVHMHIVPRWGGDTNFMSSLGETRVIPEAIEETYRRVKEQWEMMRDA